MPAIMLDLEGLSTAPDAAIISIGAVRFDPLTGTVWDRSVPEANGTFYQVINAKSSQRTGGRIDADTVMWWMGQSEEARKPLFSDELTEHSMPIEIALKDFSKWVREVPCNGMWGNGADFDNVCLNGAYQRVGQTAPWPYRLNRCYRTVVAMAPNIEFVREGVHHNALDDAISQAKHLCKIFKHIGAHA